MTTDPAAYASGNPFGGIYLASKAKHGPRWRQLRAAGWPINSTWIDECEVGKTVDWADLWTRNIREASEARVLIAYHESGETMKGALTEIGAALANGRAVLWVGLDKEYTAWNHPMVIPCSTVAEALEVAVAQCGVVRPTIVLGSSADQGIPVCPNCQLPCKPRAPALPAPLFWQCDGCGWSLGKLALGVETRRATTPADDTCHCGKQKLKSWWESITDAGNEGTDYVKHTRRACLSRTERRAATPRCKDCTAPMEVGHSAGDCARNLGRDLKAARAENAVLRSAAIALLLKTGANPEASPEWEKLEDLVNT